MALTRRRFLASSLATLGATAFSQLAMKCSNPCGYEGIYTDRFTYRPGDTINVMLSLVSGAQVDVSILRYDTVGPYQAPQTVATYPVVPTDEGNVDQPSSSGAGFSPVLQLSASDFPPGVYAVQISPNAMQPQNQTNASNTFVSDNSIAYFVVTSAVAGTFSRLLWIHDSLTGTAYGSFGGASIYGGSAGFVRTVSWLRPGLNLQAIDYIYALQFFQQNGYSFEYMDLVDLAAAPLGILSAYDLVCVVGQFEYIPHEVMMQFQSYLAGGGNVLAASHEFGAFRVRLDQDARTLTTYKWDYAGYDPYYLSGDPTQAPYVAGIGMSSPASPYETELFAQTVWAANAASTGNSLDLPLYNVDAVGWILDGTGLGEGDVLPAAFSWYASGCCLGVDNNDEPVPILTDAMRIPSSTVVWAAVWSADAQDWRLAAGQPAGDWPLLTSGFATATLQERDSGSIVVALPSPDLVRYQIGSPIYDQLRLNIINRLSVRS